MILFAEKVQKKVSEMIGIHKILLYKEMEYVILINLYKIFIKNLFVKLVYFI